MAKEIERKFLVSDEGWKESAQPGKSMLQAYLALTETLAIRVRIVDGKTAFLTFKSAQSGTTRSEFEYSIPLEDAQALSRHHIGQVIEKRRYNVAARGQTWEIDVFDGAYKGLVIAEIEIPDETSAFEKPAWLGEEVTDDPRYYNANLATADQPEVFK